MIIKADDYISTGELIKEIGISSTTWENNKAIILADLAIAAEYEVIKKGSAIVYHFLEDGEYIYQRQSKKTREKKQAYYGNKINQQFNSLPDQTQKILSQGYVFNGQIPDGKSIKACIQTGSYVGEKIYNDKETAKVTKHALGTCQNWTRNRMKELFDLNVPGAFTDLPANYLGYIDGRIWCHKVENGYEPMTQEDTDEFINYFSKSADKKAEAALITDYKNKLINKKEYVKGMTENTEISYQKARGLFHKKHGYYPMRANIYVFIVDGKEIRFILPD